MALEKQILISTVRLGTKMITCRVGDDPPLPRSIQDCFASIIMDDFQVLNEMIAREFNPLTITLCHVENMPSTPVSFDELRERFVLLSVMTL